MSGSNPLNLNEHGNSSGKLKRNAKEAGLQNPIVQELVHDSLEQQGQEYYTDDDIESCEDGSIERSASPSPKPGKKTRGRVKITMEFIDNKLRRYTTFSKRKSGIMKKCSLTRDDVIFLSENDANLFEGYLESNFKEYVHREIEFFGLKRIGNDFSNVQFILFLFTFLRTVLFIIVQAHELATLTGTQVMLLVASETGHVYTFATRKLQPILSSEAGKQLIQTCLNSPDPPESNVNQNFDQRMSAQGFEEPDLSYAPPEESKEGLMQKTYNMLNMISSQHTQSSSTISTLSQSTSAQEQVPVNLVALNNANSSSSQLATIHIPSAAYTIMSGTTQPSETRTVQLPSSEAQALMRLSVPSSASVPSALVQQQAGISDGHFTLLSPYNNIQRQMPGMQQVLWAPALHTQAAQIAVMQASSAGSEETKNGSKG